MESSLMMLLVVLVCVGLGFAGGYYYEKQQSQKQVKEHFSMSKSAIGAIIGAVVAVFLIILYVGIKSSSDTGVTPHYRRRR